MTDPRPYPGEEPVDVPTRQPDEPRRWLDDKRNVRRIIQGLFLACAVLVVLDLAYAKHAHFHLEEIFGFYGFYGFVSCVVLVLLAKVLRLVIMRREDYYDE